jgi:hypothetical protein
MSAGTGALAERIAAQLVAAVTPEVTAFAAALGAAAGARAVLFYGSNLRTGSLEGVLDFYVLLPGTEEPAIWPTVSYHERAHDDLTLRAKVATMRLATFARAAGGELTDTTIWARFVQPCALVWTADAEAQGEVVVAIAAACTTAARLAAALGPDSGTAEDYWRALFRATYAAEFRVEKGGRENDILSVNAAHFAGLLPLAWEAGGIPVKAEGERLTAPLAEKVAALLAVGLLAAGTVVAASPSDLSSAAVPPPVATAAPTVVPATPGIQDPAEQPAPAGAPGGMPGQHLPK